MYKLFSIISLLLVTACQQNSDLSVEDILKERLTSLDFRVIESLKGDYDGDGVEDVAAIIKCDACVMPNSTVQSKNIWHSDNSSSVAEQALIIALNVGSLKGNTFALLYEYDRFVSPSFKLLKAPQSEENLLIKGASPDGEVLILPSEAGIDEFVIFIDRQMIHISPEDVP